MLNVKSNAISLSSVLIMLLMLGLASATPVSAEEGTGSKGTLISCNIDGDVVNEFGPEEDVYVRGENLVPGRVYRIFIVVNVEWPPQPTLFLDKRPGVPYEEITDIVVECDFTITIEAGGTFGPVQIWEGTETVPGYYDIVADYQGLFAWNSPECKTFSPWDDVDDFGVAPGFFVIPEVPLGTIAMLLACFAAASLKRRKLS